MVDTLQGKRVAPAPMQNMDSMASTGSQKPFQAPSTYETSTLEEMFELPIGWDENPLSTNPGAPSTGWEGLMNGA